MKETTIIEREKIKKLRNPVLIIGLPGIGLIGQVVGKYLAKESKSKNVASLYSPYFPHQVLMSKKGTMRLIKNSFYVFRGRKSDILVQVGDIQALSSVGQYEVAGKVLEYAKKHGIKKVITIGGYSTGTVSDPRRIFAVVSRKESIPPLKKLGVIFGEAKGSIVGAAGLMPALASQYGMEGICILGETHGGYIDTASAKQILQLLSKYLDFEVNLKRIDERAKKSEKAIRQLEEEIKKNMEMPEQPHKVSYIR
ncbi:MAG: proteasome assembly chaperone family protein [Candidatus Micrarchaeota archaeon]